MTEIEPVFQNKCAPVRVSNDIYVVPVMEVVEALYKTRLTERFAPLISPRFRCVSRGEVGGLSRDHQPLEKWQYVRGSRHLYSWFLAYSFPVHAKDSRFTLTRCREVFRSPCWFGPFQSPTVTIVEMELQVPQVPYNAKRSPGPTWSRGNLGICVLRGGSLRSIVVRSMYLDYSKKTSTIGTEEE